MNRSCLGHSIWLQENIQKIAAPYLSGLCISGSCRGHACWDAKFGSALPASTVGYTTCPIVKLGSPQAYYQCGTHGQFVADCPSKLKKSVFVDC